MDRNHKFQACNEVTIAGHLARDPELKYIASGTAVCEFAIAVNRKKKGEDVAMFVNVTCWKQVAEYVGENIKKGDPVTVAGMLDEDEWQDKSGQKRTKTRIQAYRVSAQAWPVNSQGSGGRQGQQQLQGQQTHSSGGGQQPIPQGQGGHYNQQQQNAPAPRPIEEPIAEDDIPF